MPPFLTLRSGLLAWAIAGPILAGGVVYFSMLTREAIVVSGAVRVARGEETVKCNAQLQAVATTINDAADRSVSDAREAAAEIKPAPDVKAACKASSSCRDRSAQ